MVGKAYTVCSERISENKLRSISLSGVKTQSVFNYLSSRLSGLFNPTLRAFRRGRRPVNWHVFNEAWKAARSQREDKAFSLVVPAQCWVCLQSAALDATRPLALLPGMGFPAQLLPALLEQCHAYKGCMAGHRHATLPWHGEGCAPVVLRLKSWRGSPYPDCKKREQECRTYK